MTRNRLPGFAALVMADKPRPQIDAEAMEQPCPSQLGRMAEAYGDMNARIDETRRARNKLALLVAILLAVLLGLLGGWFATQSIAKAAHDVAHAEEWSER